MDSTAEQVARLIRTALTEHSFNEVEPDPTDASRMIVTLRPRSSSRTFVCRVDVSEVREV